MVYVRIFSTEAPVAADDYEIATDSLSKAEFRIGEDGQVEELGLILEAEMGEGKIWFKKAGSKNVDGPEKSFEARSSTVKTENKQGASGAGGQRKLFSKSENAWAPLFA